MKIAYRTTLNFSFSTLLYKKRTPKHISFVLFVDVFQGVQNLYWLYVLYFIRKILEYIAPLQYVNYFLKIWAEFVHVFFPIIRPCWAQIFYVRTNILIFFKWVAEWHMFATEREYIINHAICICHIYKR